MYTVRRNSRESSAYDDVPFLISSSRLVADFGMSAVRLGMQISSTHTSLSFIVMVAIWLRE